MNSAAHQLPDLADDVEATIDRALAGAVLHCETVMSACRPGSRAHKDAKAYHRSLRRTIRARSTTSTGPAPPSYLTLDEIRVRTEQALLRRYGFGHLSSQHDFFHGAFAVLQAVYGEQHDDPNDVIPPEWRGTLMGTDSRLHKISEGAD